jgi:Ca2+-binding RTX toxin-like protein
MTAKQNTRFVPRLESLEGRAVPAFIIGIDAEGDLLIDLRNPSRGQSIQNTVVVRDAGSHWRVDVDGVPSFHLKSSLRTSNIECYLGDGNDYFENRTPLMADVEGNAGNDTLIGGPSADGLDGGAGNDVLHGMGGNDYLFGGTGNDILRGGSGEDTLDGYVGDDTLYGDDGNDTLLGSHGNDRLYGGAGRDMLYGEGGNDYLDGGVGDGFADYLNGGPGADTFVYDRARSGIFVYNRDHPADFNGRQDRIVFP